MMVKARGRALIVTSDGRYREEHHRFTSFFDGISGRFSPRTAELNGHASQRFQRLDHARGQRRYRETNAIVEAEFKEIRDFSHMRDWLRMWTPKIAVVALFVLAILILLLAP